MSDLKYSLSIKYRMTCEKSDPRNFSCDTRREKGYYWLALDGIAITEELSKTGLSELNYEKLSASLPSSYSVPEIQKRIESVTVPEGCEAVWVNFRVYLPESTGGNGPHRRNVSFEYFKDFVREEQK